MLVEFRVLTTIQFVHDQFPDGVAAGGAVLIVTMATVGHAEVESVWPQRDVLKWSGDGRIVKEGLLFHHGELVVTSHAQVGSAHTYDRVVGDVGEFVDDETSSGHFFSPVIHRSFGPESFVVVVPVTTKKERKPKNQSIIHRYRSLEEVRETRKAQTRLT